MLKCKKCGGENINVQLVQNQIKSKTRHRGIIYHLIRAFLVLCTCGLWLLVPSQKEVTKHKTKMVKVAVCNSCGESWNLQA